MGLLCRKIEPLYADGNPPPLGMENGVADLVADRSLDLFFRAASDTPGTVKVLDRVSTAVDSGYRQSPWVQVNPHAPQISVCRDRSRNDVEHGLRAPVVIASDEAIADG